MYYDATVSGASGCVSALVELWPLKYLEMTAESIQLKRNFVYQNYLKIIDHQY